MVIPLRLLAATTLRTILGTKNLTELLSDREAISKAIVDQIDGPTDRWGIEVGDFFFLFCQFFIFYTYLPTYFKCVCKYI